MTKVTVDIDLDSASEMVRTMLMDDYQRLTAEGCEDSIDLLKALDVVIEYYTVPSKYQQWVIDRENHYYDRSTD